MERWREAQDRVYRTPAEQARELVEDEPGGARGNTSGNIRACS